MQWGLMLWPKCFRNAAFTCIHLGEGLLQYTIKCVCIPSTFLYFFFYKAFFLNLYIQISFGALTLHSNVQAAILIVH